MKTNATATSPAPLRAFHGDTAVKDKYLTRVRLHRARSARAVWWAAAAAAAADAAAADAAAARYWRRRYSDVWWKAYNAHYILMSDKLIALLQAAPVPAAA